MGNCGRCSIFLPKFLAPALPTPVRFPRGRDAEVPGWGPCHTWEIWCLLYHISLSFNVASPSPFKKNFYEWSKLPLKRKLSQHSGPSWSLGPMWCQQGKQGTVNLIYISPLGCQPSWVSWGPLFHKPRAFKAWNWVSFILFFFYKILDVLCCGSYLYSHTFKITYHQLSCW